MPLLLPVRGFWELQQFFISSCFILFIHFLFSFLIPTHFQDGLLLLLLLLLLLFTNKSTKLFIFIPYTISCLSASLIYFSCYLLKVYISLYWLSKLEIKCSRKKKEIMISFVFLFFNVPLKKKIVIRNKTKWYKNKNSMQRNE